MNAFDKNLKRLRIRRNLKQEELAEKLHVTRQTVSGWETGRRQPDLDMLKKLAEALDVDMQELIYGVTSNVYPSFQRKYVICTAVSGSIAAVLLLFRLLLLPYIDVLCNTHHWGTILTLCTILLPQIGSFAFGAFFPGMIRLFMPIPMKNWSRWLCLIIGLTALLPVLLFWLGLPPCSKWILSNFGNTFLIYLLPAVSGVSSLLAAFREPTP